MRTKQNERQVYPRTDDMVKLQNERHAEGCSQGTWQERRMVDVKKKEKKREKKKTRPLVTEKGRREKESISRGQCQKGVQLRGLSGIKQRSTEPHERVPEGLHSPVHGQGAGQGVAGHRWASALGGHLWVAGAFRGRTEASAGSGDSLWGVAGTAATPQDLKKPTFCELVALITPMLGS